MKLKSHEYQLHKHYTLYKTLTYKSKRGIKRRNNEIKLVLHLGEKKTGQLSAIYFYIEKNPSLFLQNTFLSVHLFFFQMYTPSRSS